VPGLGTDGYENKQGDCEQCKAAHGMTPVMDDTEAVPWEFLKTFILKKKKHSMRQNSMAYGKDNSQKRKKLARGVPHPSHSHREPRSPMSAFARRGGEGWDEAPATPQRVEGPRYPSLGQRPRSQPPNPSAG
jgi:hypothetical protein